MTSSQTHLPIVSLQFSLADDPRTHIKEWHEDLCAKAYGLCPQWDITGAITLIADDAYWNAMPGHITTPAAGTTPAVFKARPDFTPPAALDPAASPVDLANWRLEMDMHFAYAMASNQQGAGYRYLGQFGRVQQWLPVQALLGTASTGAVPEVFVLIFKGEGDFG